MRAAAARRSRWPCAGRRSGQGGREVERARRLTRKCSRQAGPCRAPLGRRSPMAISGTKVGAGVSLKLAADLHLVRRTGTTGGCVVVLMVGSASWAPVEPRWPALREGGGNPEAAPPDCGACAPPPPGAPCGRVPAAAGAGRAGGRSGLTPNPQMQPTSRTVPSAARAPAADGGQRNKELCGRRLELAADLHLVRRHHYDRGTV
jgi:hypothetical protein